MYNRMLEELKSKIIAIDSERNGVRLHTLFTSDPKNFLEERTSKDLVNRVVHERISQLGKNAPDFLLNYYKQYLNKELKAYIHLNDILRIWTIPRNWESLIRHSDNLTPIKDGDYTCYLWEELLECLGKEPFDSDGQVLQGILSMDKTEDPNALEVCAPEGLRVHTFISKEETMKIMDLDVDRVSLPVEGQNKYTYQYKDTKWYPWPMFKSVVYRLKPECTSHPLFEAYSKSYSNLIYKVSKSS